MKRLVRIILLCEVMTLAVGASAQSIADLARQERDRKKAAAARTYTNDNITVADVTGIPAEPVAGAAPTANTPGGVTAGATIAGAATPATSTAAAVPSKPAGPVDNKGRDEKYWREQFAAARN